jgi:predicted nucleic acid-binding protein
VLGLLPAQAQWFALPTPMQPDAVASPGLAFDAARQATVLFGGDSNVGLHDRTWTWDGAAWTERFPAVHPTARTMVGMAYDAARQRVVLFGGFGQFGGGANESNETWEWDGCTWALRQPLHAPSPRGGAAMAYDSTRQRVVLFGGGLGGYMMPTFDDTWEWDGVDWVERTPAHRPTAARSGNLAHDAQRGVSVLFGGLSTLYQKQNATWEWDGLDWIRRYPAHVPTARYAAAMAHDSGRGRTVLFGGGLDSGPANDTWEYDGVVWTQVLHEFVHVAVRKLALPLDTVRQRVRLCARFETVGCSAAAALEALDLHALHQLSFRDAQILQAARQGGCVQVPSEYLQAGAGIAGVRIVNPFAQTERALPY